MSVKMSKFPHIEQFRTVIKRVHDVTRYSGKDLDGNAIYDAYKPLPMLKFVGTVKLHGTNAAIGRTNDGTHWSQSRENIITPEKDNAGFATFCYKNKQAFDEIFDRLSYDREQFESAIIYGEWCGKGVQKGVAISELEKMFVVFHIKLIAKQQSEDEFQDANVYLSDEDVKSVVIANDDARIFNIYDFETYEMDIDFKHPELATNKLIEITENVETCCPVGKYFGVEGVGEGIVWHCVTAPYIRGAYRFKVKGEKHSASKVKKLANVDVEKVNSIKECVEKIITDNRMNQGLEHLKMNQLEIIPQNIGTFIKWVVTDAIREELDTIIESGLEPKEIGGVASKVARDWFFENTQFNLTYSHEQ